MTRKLWQSALATVVLVVLAYQPTFLSGQDGPPVSATRSLQDSSSRNLLPPLAPPLKPLGSQKMNDIRELNPEKETFRPLASGSRNQLPPAASDARSSRSTQSRALSDLGSQDSFGRSKAAESVPQLPDLSQNNLRNRLPRSRPFGDQNLQSNEPPVSPLVREPAVSPNQWKMDDQTNRAPAVSESLRRGALSQQYGSQQGNSDLRQSGAPEVAASSSFPSPRGTRNFPQESNRFRQVPGAQTPPVGQVPAGSRANFNDRRSPNSVMTSETPSVIERAKFDDQVRPAKFQQTQPASTKKTLKRAKIDTRDAKRLLARYAVSSAPDPLPGKPVRMSEMLKNTQPHLRRQMVQQYWETYYDWATVLNAAANLNFLNQVAAPSAQNDRVLLNAARQAAENQILSAEIQLGKSQSKLKQFQSNQEELLPLPSDQPHVRHYDTYYGYYDQRGQIPANFKGIDAMLPKSRQLIANRATTVETAKAALNQTRNALAAGRAEMGTLLEAARLWNDAEQRLIANVVSYNQAIGDYSMSLFANGKTPEQIAKMLIPKAKAKPASQSTGMLNARRGSNAGRPSNLASRQQGTQNFDLSPSRTASSQNQFGGGVDPRGTQPVRSFPGNRDLQNTNLDRSGSPLVPNRASSKESTFGRPGTNPNAGRSDGNSGFGSPPIQDNRREIENGFGGTEKTSPPNSKTFGAPNGFSTSNTLPPNRKSTVPPIRKSSEGFGGGAQKKNTPPPSQSFGGGGSFGG